MLTIWDFMKGLTKMAGILEVISVGLKAQYNFYLNMKISLSVIHRIVCNCKAEFI